MDPEDPIFSEPDEDDAFWEWIRRIGGPRIKPGDILIREGPPRPPPVSWWGWGGVGRPVLGIGAVGWTLIAVAAVAVAVYRGTNAYRAAQNNPPPGPSGKSCGNPAVAQVDFDVSDSSFWGSDAAYKGAMAKAQALCASLAPLCAGGAPCSAGTTCTPNLSIQEVNFDGHFGLYTTVDIKFRCPCECI